MEDEDNHDQIKAEITETTTITIATEKRTVMPPPPQAPDLLFANAMENKLYWDRSHYDSPESQKRALARSKTVYVGNLAFSTRSSHLISHFRQVGGPVSRVVLGLDRFRKTPCGFCFVEYRHRRDALLAVANLSGTKLDGRVIRVELDAGFQPGRQFGRGVSGGQVRDERRATGRVPDAANAPSTTTPRYATMTSP
jgi:nuclear cap-binding protein subunit 2